MIEEKLKRNNINNIFIKKLLIMIIPSVLIGLSLTLYSYYGSLVSSGYLQTVLIVSLGIIIFSIFIGFVLLYNKMIGTVYQLDDFQISEIRNIYNVKIEFREKPIIRESIFGIYIISKNRKIVVPKSLDNYQKIRKKLLDMKLC